MLTASVSDGQQPAGQVGNCRRHGTGSLFIREVERTVGSNEAMKEYSTW